MRLPRLVLLVSLAGLAGCSTTTSQQFVTVNGTTIATETTDATAGPLSAGVSTTTINIPAADESAASGYIGQWVLTRAAQPVCELELMPKNAKGVYRAKTRSCASIDLARIALWTTEASGVELFDFEQKIVLILKPTLLGGYQGQLADGTKLTLSRLTP